MHELKGDIVAVVPNDWMASRGNLPNRYGQLQAGDALYREQLIKEFLESDETDFFGWVRRREFTTHCLRLAPSDGAVAMTLQWLPRAHTGDVRYLVAGDVHEDARRSERRAAALAPAPAPAPTLVADDDELDEGYDQPKWAEGSRSAWALELIFSAKPTLISDPPPDFDARRVIAKRLCKPNPSTAPDDVRLREEAFAWGDDQWARWHLDNDSSDDDDEEMGESDPFSEENLPPATRGNRQAILDLFKRRFKIDAPTRGNSQSRLFGDFLGYLRACISRNVYP